MTERMKAFTNCPNCGHPYSKLTIDYTKKETMTYTTSCKKCKHYEVSTKPKIKLSEIGK